MPVLSRFHGIVVYMNYNDHDPPHFHARHGGQEVSVGIKDGLVKGEMSARSLRLVLEWADLHRSELSRNWERARSREPLTPIPPLR
jgi:hypothetical protein